MATLQRWSFQRRRQSKEMCSFTICANLRKTCRLRMHKNVCKKLSLQFY